MTYTINALNQQYGIAGKVTFVNGKGNLPVVVINNELSSAALSLYGAHLLSFTPAGAADLLWMSDASFYEAGKPIRGGIPLCFPWFGPHATDAAKPQHGFGRLSHWQVQEVSALGDGATRVVLMLAESAATLELWPHAFIATAEFIIGTSLQLNLKVTNTGTGDFEYSNALHTYFKVSDIDRIKVAGLAQASFYSGAATTLQTQETELLSFDRGEETNRRYVQHTSNCAIHDEGLNRKIEVSKSGSKVTVVWNPWQETEKKMVDIQPGGHKTFICIEPANAYPGIDMIQLKPGESHTLGTSFGLV